MTINNSGTETRWVQYGKYRFLIFFLIALPICLFGAYVWLHALNVPFVDDNELIAAVNIILDEPSEILRVMTRQQNDHRSFFPRVGAITSYLIAGKTNIRVVILLGYLNLLLLGYSFYLIYKSACKDLAAFIPVVFLLFSPVIYGVQLWAITSFQQTLSVAFSMLSLHFLRPEKEKSWYWGILLAVMASLTILDGLSTIPVGIFWLVTQRRWKHALIYLGFAAVYLTVFFYGFEFSSASKFPALGDLLQVVGLSFVAFTGAFSRVFSDSQALKLSFLTGSVILSVFAFLQIRKIWSKGKTFSFQSLLNIPFDFTEIAFLRLLACAMMISIGRSSDGPAGMLATRFSLYFVSIVILFYLLLLNVLKNRSLYVFKISAFSFSFLFWLFMYVKFDSYVKLMEAELKTDSFNYTNHRRYLHQYLDMTELPPSFYKYYEFPEFFSKSSVDFWKETIQRQEGKGQYPLKASYVGNASPYERLYFPVTEVTLDDLPVTVPQTDVFMGIMSTSNPEAFYLVALRDLNNIWQKRLFKPEMNRKFYVNVHGKVEKGLYHAAICWVENGHPKVIPLAGDLQLGVDAKLK